MIKQHSNTSNKKKISLREFSSNGMVIDSGKSTNELSSNHRMLMIKVIIIIFSVDVGKDYQKSYK